MKLCVHLEPRVYKQPSLEKLTRLANILPGGGGWRKKLAWPAKPIFLLVAAASRSKKSLAAAKGGGLGVYRWSP